MSDLWYFFPSHLIPAEHTTQIHTVKERVTQDFTVWIWVVCSAGIKWLGKKYQRSNTVPCNMYKLVYLHFIQATAHHWRTDNNFAGRNAESPLIVSEPQQLWVRVELAFSLKHFQFPPPPTVTKHRNILAVLMNDGQKSDDIDHDLTENIAFTLVPAASQCGAGLSAVPWA